MISIFKKNNNFIERSILGALSFFKDATLSDEYASQNGFLQSLEPRIKTITFFLFLLAVLFTKETRLIILMYLFCLILAYLSRINIRFFLKRTWIFIPLFSLFIAIPALFNVFSPGDAVFDFNILRLKFIITRQGLSSASLFVARVVTSVSWVILLSLTTRHTELLKVLRIFKIPQVFVLTIGMCYRYIYLFAEIIENTFRAIKSRVGISIHYRKGQGLVSWNIANLWQRSVKMNEEVYSAMLSRGYTGEPKLLHGFKIKAQDLIWLYSAVLILAAVIYLNYRLKL
jgi:cobalt/nickel transport system permease protein